MTDTRPLVPRRSPLRGLNESPRNSGPNPHFVPRHHPVRQASIDSNQSFAWSGGSELSASTTASSLAPNKPSPWASPIDTRRPSIEEEEDMRGDAEWRGLPDSPDVAEDVDAHLDRISDFFPDRERWSASEEQELIHGDEASRPESVIDKLDERITSKPRFSWLDLPAEGGHEDDRDDATPPAFEQRRVSDASTQAGYIRASAIPSPPIMDAFSDAPTPRATDAGHLAPSATDHLAPSTARASQLARQAVAAASKLATDRRNSPMPPSADEPSYFDLPVAPSSSSAASTPGGAAFLKPPLSPATTTHGFASRRESATSVYSTASYATTSAHAPAPTLEPVPALPALDQRSSWSLDMFSGPVSPSSPASRFGKTEPLRPGQSKAGGRRRSRLSMQRNSYRRESFRPPPSPRSPRNPLPRFSLPDSPREGDAVESALAKLDGDGASTYTPSLDRSLPSLPSSLRPSPRSSTLSPSRASKRASARSSIVIGSTTKRLSIAPSLPGDILPESQSKRTSVIQLGGIEKRQLPRRPRPRLGRRILQSQFNGGFFASHCRTWDIVTEEEVVEPPKPRQPRLSRPSPAPASMTPTSARQPSSAAYKRISTPLDDPSQPSLYELYSREGQKKRADEEDEKPLATLSPHGVRTALTADALSKQLSAKGSPGSLTPSSAGGPRSALSPPGFPFAGSYISTGGAKSAMSMSGRSVLSPGAPGLPPAMPFAGFPPMPNMPPGMYGMMGQAPASMANYAPLRSDMTTGARHNGPASTMSASRPRQSPSSNLSVPTSARRSPKGSPTSPPRASTAAPPPAPSSSISAAPRMSMSSRPHRGVNPELKIDTARAAAQQREKLRAEAAAQAQAQREQGLRRSQAAHPATTASVTPKTPRIVHASSRSDGSHRSMHAALVDVNAASTEASEAAMLPQQQQPPKSGKWGSFFKRSKSVDAKSAKLSRKEAEARVNEAVQRSRA